MLIPVSRIKFSNVLLMDPQKKRLIWLKVSETKKIFHGSAVNSCLRHHSQGVGGLDVQKVHSRPSMLLRVQI